MTSSLVLRARNIVWQGRSPGVRVPLISPPRGRGTGRWCRLLDDISAGTGLRARASNTGLPTAPRAGFGWQLRVSLRMRVEAPNLTSLIFMVWLNQIAQQVDTSSLPVQNLNSFKQDSTFLPQEQNLAVASGVVQSFDLVGQPTPSQ